MSLGAGMTEHEFPWRVNKDTARGDGIDPRNVPTEGLCTLKIRDGKRSTICTGFQGCAACDYPGAARQDLCDRTWAGTMWIDESTLVNGSGWGEL